MCTNGEFHIENILFKPSINDLKMMVGTKEWPMVKQESFARIFRSASKDMTPKKAKISDTHTSQSGEKEEAKSIFASPSGAMSANDTRATASWDAS